MGRNLRRGKMSFKGVEECENRCREGVEYMASPLHLNSTFNYNLYFNYCKKVSNSTFN